MPKWDARGGLRHPTIATRGRIPEWVGCPNGPDARMGRMRVLYLATQKRAAGIDTCPAAPSQNPRHGCCGPAHIYT